MGQAEYGAFVEVLPGLQGLLHASRMGSDTLPTPGTSVEVRVLSVDPRSRRIELAPRSFDPAAQKAHTVGVTVTGKATEVDQREIGLRVAGIALQSDKDRPIFGVELRLRRHAFHPSRFQQRVYENCRRFVAHGCVTSKAARCAVVSSAIAPSRECFNYWNRDRDSRHA
jgi:transcriptional accessory protein Tex/SPT6